jgi:prevent-host-death family protein
VKIAQLNEAKDKLSEYVRLSQDEHVLITSHGKPAAILIGVEGEGMEDVLLGKSVRFWEALEDLMTSANPRFWAEIERSRKEAPAGRPLAAIRAETDALLAQEKKLGREMTSGERKAHLARTRGAKVRKTGGR